MSLILRGLRGGKDVAKGQSLQEGLETNAKHHQVANANNTMNDQHELLVKDRELQVSGERESKHKGTEDEPESAHCGIKIPNEPEISVRLTCGADPCQHPSWPKRANEANARLITVASARRGKALVEGIDQRGALLKGSPLHGVDILVRFADGPGCGIGQHTDACQSCPRANVSIFCIMNVLAQRHQRCFNVVLGVEQSRQQC